METHGIVNKVNWTDYLLIHLHQPKGTPKYGQLPIFETNITDLDERILANFNNYLVINGTATYYNIDEYTAKVEHSAKDDDYADSKLYIPCSLCYGGNRWYSESGTTTDVLGTTIYLPGWVDYPSTFNLPLYSATERKHYIGKDFNVRNNINWYDGIESTNGHKIALNDIGISKLANLKFTMFAPVTPNTDYRLDSIFLKDFSITVESSKNNFVYSNGTITDFTYSDELNNVNTSGDTNITYENVIDEGYVEEMDSIKNKITTFDKEQISNSVIAFSITDKSSLFYATTVAVESLGNEKMKEEEYTVNRLVEQYSTPSIILDLTLNDNIPMYSLINNSIIDSKKKFIINSKSLDLGLGITTYNLIEKK